MKQFKFLCAIGLILGSISLPSSPVMSQSGGEVPIEINPEVPLQTPVEPAPETPSIVPGTQSDVTLPNPVEIVSPEGNATGIVGTNLGVDRESYETLLSESSFDDSIQLLEEYQAFLFSQYLGIDLKGKVTSAEDIAKELCTYWRQSGQKPAFIYISAQSVRLETFTIFPQCSKERNENSFLRKTIEETTRAELVEQAKLMYGEIANEGRDYLEPAQKIYNWLITPIESELIAQNINTIVFSLDSGLRTLPVAALYDGKEFLMQKYSVAIVPSFGLTDISYFDIRQSSILAMGAEEFAPQVPITRALPSVPIEVQNIIKTPWNGSSFLNEQFTLENFIAQNQEKRFGIVHLATHGRFEAGELSNSFIQFYNQALTLPELREVANRLNWTSTDSTLIELLVLSACQTAFGSENAELGFAGFAVHSGVKSVLASLWEVSDVGTLALMSEFYQQLIQTPIKAKALQQTQKAILEGKVRIEDGYIRLSNGTNIPLPPKLDPQTKIDLLHPFYWSAFTLIGNWN
jgi:CHAT domain-containing protein